MAAASALSSSAPFFPSLPFGSHPSVCVRMRTLGVHVACHVSSATPPGSAVGPSTFERFLLVFFFVSFLSFPFFWPNWRQFYWEYAQYCQVMPFGEILQSTVSLSGSQP